MTQSMSKKQYYFLTITISAVMLLIIFLLFSITPFGNRTWLTIDLGQQYIDFFAYYKDTLLHHPEQFFYSFSKSIGGEMVSLWAYYLMSPFNLLFLLFPNSMIPLGVSLLIFLKLLCCTLSFSILLEKKFNRRDFTAILFSLSYGFMSYLAANQLNVMWLDALIGLPIIILGIDFLLQEKTPTLYVFALSITVISNYYTGYMICLFLLLYFPYASLQVLKPLTWKHFWKQWLRFVSYSFIAIGLTMVLLLPSAVALAGSKGTTTSIAWSLKSEYNPFLLFSKLIIGSFNFEQMKIGYPNIFVGTLALFSFICYFKNSEISKFQRLYAFVITLFFLISFNIEFFDKLWHAGQLPNWYPYRFSFLFCFWMILIGYQQVTYHKKITSVETFSYFFFILLVSIGCIIFPQNDIALWQIVLTFALSMGILYGLILASKEKGFNQKLLNILVISELLANSIITLSRLGYVMNSDFTAYQSALSNWSTAMHPIDTTFFRSEKNILRSKNDSLQVPTYGVSHFSSTFEKETEHFFEAIGVRQGNAFVTYSNGTLISDALLGIKRTFITTTGDSYNEHWERKDLEDLEKVALFKEGMVVNNPNVLSIAYPLKEIVKVMKVPTNAPMTLQNQLVNAFVETNKPSDVFTTLSYKTEYENIQGTPTLHQRIKVQDDTQPGILTLSFTPETNDPIYLEMAGTMDEDALEITLNEEPYSFYPVQSKPVLISIAKNKKGIPQTLRILINKANFEFSNLQLYQLDEVTLNERLQTEKQYELKVDSFSPTHFTGVMSVPSKVSVLTTVPYSTGWSILVDGQKVETYKILDSLLGFNLPEGTHRIEYLYTTPYLLEGIMISLLSLLLLFFILYRRKKTDAS